MKYCKVLSVEDYKLFTEDEHVLNIRQLLKNVTHRFEHPHRKWEYGIVLNALRKNQAKDVLDVGGGGSVFAPAAAWLGMQVTTVDPGEVGSWIDAQSKTLQKELIFEQLPFEEFKSKNKFDAVTCISTIEHMPNYLEMIVKMASYVRKGGLLALTFDFHPSGEQRVSGHLKTFNLADVEEFMSILKDKGFTIFEDGFDYIYTTDNVNNYTFASLIMKRE